MGLRIAKIRIDAFEELGAERYEGFDGAVQRELKTFASWLATVPLQNIDRLRERGMNIGVLVNLEIDQDQFDFCLPPELSLQLGRLGLRLDILSNE